MRIVILHLFSFVSWPDGYHHSIEEMNKNNKYGKMPHGKQCHITLGSFIQTNYVSIQNLD